MRKHLFNHKFNKTKNLVYKLRSMFNCFLSIISTLTTRKFSKQSKLKVTTHLFIRKNPITCFFC